jgi:hypothetical protein
VLRSGYDVEYATAIAASAAVWPSSRGAAACNDKRKRIDSVVIGLHEFFLNGHPRRWTTADQIETPSVPSCGQQAARPRRRDDRVKGASVKIDEASDRDCSRDDQPFNAPPEL